MSTNKRNTKNERIEKIKKTESTTKEMKNESTNKETMKPQNNGEKNEKKNSINGSRFIAKRTKVLQLTVLKTKLFSFGRF